MEHIDLLVQELCRYPESEWLEFKMGNADPKMIGQRISALANGACLKDRSKAYLVWGIEDEAQKIKGTDIRLKEEKCGREELENWLKHQLSVNADFEFQYTDIDGKHIELIVISPAREYPVSFEKNNYIRVGSYTKNLKDYPPLEGRLWDELRRRGFESIAARIDISLEEVHQLLSSDTYFDALHLPRPTSIDEATSYLIKDQLVIRQDNGLYAITNLGAILFAKQLSEFPSLLRKAIRVVQYEGLDRNLIVKDEIIEQGYALSFREVVKLVQSLLPSSENVSSVERRIETPFPLMAIREAIANSLIHQDFSISGCGPIIELFSNRVEISNPGQPLVEYLRIVDMPPRSRNEALASLMRRFGLCEELGRGWDRMVISCEAEQLPPPMIHIYESDTTPSTKVTLFRLRGFSTFTKQEKLWATYLHSIIRFLNSEALTNSTLRQRFGLSPSAAGSISRLINEAVAENLIKPIDPATAKKHMKYRPYWGI